MSDNQIDQEIDQIEDIEAVEEAAETSLPEDEKKSVDSVDKASDVTKKAPKRKGDKDVKDEPSGSPKTKAGMINAMFNKMNGMKTVELSKMYSSYHEDVEQEDSEELEETS